MGHAQGWMAFLSMPVEVVHVGRRRMGDGVGTLGLFLGSVAWLFVLFARMAFRLPELVELIPGNFAFAHPEGPDFNLVLGTLIVLAVGLILGAAHGEDTAGNGDHVEFYLGTG